ncbi:MAG TPA: hypothetical protein VFN74_14345 [Chloroflexota bacterium]|nr:hypothetical protein [Chloroflexota bacterium]
MRWDSRRSVSVDELRSAPIGDPWLSAGLVKLGDAIYLMKWESGWGAPELRRMRSLDDARLFGINGATYGRTVMDGETWEFLHGHRIEALERGELEPVVPAAPAAPAVPAAPTGPTRAAPPPVRGPALSVVGAAVNGGRGAKEGSGWIVGEVRNDGDAPAPGYTISATLTDEAGVILATQRSEVPLALPPGASYPFALDVLRLPRGARAEVRVTSGISAQSGALQHVVLASERVHLREEKRGAGATETVSFVARGNVRNASGGGASVIRVLVAFVDRHGRNRGRACGCSSAGAGAGVSPGSPLGERHVSAGRR